LLRHRQGQKIALVERRVSDRSTTDKRNWDSRNAVEAKDNGEVFWRKKKWQTGKVKARERLRSEGRKIQEVELICPKEVAQEFPSSLSAAQTSPS
jgi:hypothetical protein